MVKAAGTSFRNPFDEKEDKKNKKTVPSVGATRNHPTRPGIKQRYTGTGWTNIRGGGEETTSKSSSFKKRTRYSPGVQKTKTTPPPTKVGTEQTVTNRRGRKIKTGKVWDGTKWVKGPLKRGQNLPASAGDKNAKGGEGDKKTWPTGQPPTNKSRDSQGGNVRGTWVNGKFVVQGRGEIRNNVKPKDQPPKVDPNKPKDTNVAPKKDVDDGSTSDSAGRAWMKNTANSPAAKSGAWTPEERWKIQKALREKKAKDNTRRKKELKDLKKNQATKPVKKRREDWDIA